MTIRLPEHLERYVDDQVLAGRFCSEGEVIFDALERHRQAHQLHAAPSATRRDELSSQEVQQRLFDAGLVSERAVGTRRLYRLNPAAVAALRDQLDTYWQRALARYADVVDRATEEKE